MRAARMAVKATSYLELIKIGEPKS
jgi:hypothetical protein